MVGWCFCLSNVPFNSTFVVKCVQYSDVNLSEYSYRNWYGKSQSVCTYLNVNQELKTKKWQQQQLPFFTPYFTPYMYRYVQEAKTLAVIISLFSNTISRIWYNIALGFMGPHGPPPRFLCSAYYFSAACSNISQNTKEPCDVRIFPRTWCVWNQWSIHSGIEQIHCAKHSTKKK